MPDSIQPQMWTDDGCKPHETAVDNHLSLRARSAPTPTVSRELRGPSLPAAVVRHVFACQPTWLSHSSREQGPITNRFPPIIAWPGAENDILQTLSHSVPEYEMPHTFVWHIAAMHCSTALHSIIGLYSSSGHGQPARPLGAPQPESALRRWRAGCNVSCESPPRTLAQVYAGMRRADIDRAAAKSRSQINRTSSFELSCQTLHTNGRPRFLARGGWRYFHLHLGGL